MPERIYKLQPDRTVALRGFDHFGAAAAVHSATPQGFRASGVFRDPADFAVVVLYDADNFYEHPRIKHLPDFDFSGLTLQFDVAQQHLMPLNCTKYPTIDWPFLGVEQPDGSRTRVRLSDYIVEKPAGSDDPASGEFEVIGAGLQGFDRLTLWYLNLAFDYIVPGKIEVEYSFVGGMAGSQHSVIVRDRAYVYTQQAGDTAATVVERLAALVNEAQDADVTAGPSEQTWLLKLRAKGSDGSSFVVTASGNLAETLWHVSAETAARALAEQVAGADCVAMGAPFNLDATVTGRRIRFTTRTGGYDANFVKLYATWKNERLRGASDVIHFTGGSSEACCA